MLKESAEEKGCFAGCLPFIAVGAIIGAIFGIRSFDGVCIQYGLVGPIGKITGLLLGSFFGIIAGGIVGLITGRIITARKTKEEDF